MQSTNKILYAFLSYSIKEMERVLRDMKPLLKDSDDPDERNEYERRKKLIKDLKKQLKELEGQIDDID